MYLNIFATNNWHPSGWLARGRIGDDDISFKLVLIGMLLLIRNYLEVYIFYTVIKV